MPECCGEERDTPHCPQCGKRLQDLNLYTLLQHLRKQTALRNNDVIAMRHRLETEWKNWSPTKKAQVMAADESGLRKWQGWLDAVEELKQRAEAKEKT
jgi:hypothetical protein